MEPSTDIRAKDNPLQGNVSFRHPQRGHIFALYRILSQPVDNPAIPAHLISNRYHYEQASGLILWAIIAEGDDEPSEAMIAALPAAFREQAAQQHPALIRVMNRNHRRYENARADQHEDLRHSGQDRLLE